MKEEEIEIAKKFCKYIDCEMNEHGQYIYISKNGASHISLPHILLEYLDWLKTGALTNTPNP